MRSLPAALVLVLSSLAVVCVVLAGGTAAQTYGPGSWEIGMEWSWESNDTSQRSYIDDHTKLATASGKYDVWRTQTSYEGETTSAHRVTMWVENNHRRAYDEVSMRNGGDPITSMTEYSPPAPFPMWEGIGPGADIQLEVTEYTSYRSGVQYMGSEETTWDWYAVASPDVHEVETPAGTFEGFNVTVYKEEVDGDDAALYRYFYSHDARHWVATYDSDEELDLKLDELKLDPPPVARGFAAPNLLEAEGETTLYGHQSHTFDGEIASHEWRIPAGVTVDNTTLTEETTIEATNVTVRLDGADQERYRFVLTVTGTNGQTASDPVTVRVVEPDDRYQLEGPDWTEVGEPTELHLIPPKNGTVQEVDWRLEGPDGEEQLDEKDGLDAEIVFSQAGSYTVSVTYTDNEGTTATLTHSVFVVGGDGFSIQGDPDADTVQAGADAVGPAIVNPENGTRMATSSVDIAVHTSGLENPKLVLPNGLRVPLETDEPIDIATVPLTPPESTIRLVDGNQTLDQVTLLYEEPADPGTAESQDTGTNQAPFPWLSALLLAPLLRRRTR